MKFISSLEKFTEKNATVFGLHFPVPNKIAIPLINGDNRRVICIINGEKEISSGLMPFGEYWYLLVNQSLKKELHLEIGDTVSLELKKDESPYGMPMPEELATVLEQDAEGNAQFHNLTPGKQRNLIYLVSNVKNVESRLNKAFAIVDHLKEKPGKLDFKQLNAKIKDYNQRNKLNL